VESALQRWLELQCQMLAGTQSALAVYGRSEHAPGAHVAAWPSPEQVDRRLRATVQIAHERGRLSVQQPDATLHETGAPSYLAVPLTREGRVVGAVGVCVPAVAPGDLKSLTDVLGWGVRSLELQLAAEGDRDRWAELISLSGDVLDHGTLAESAHAFSADLARGLGCERVAVGVLRFGRMRVKALSTSLRFADQSDAVRDLRLAMEEASEQDSRIELPAPDAAPPQGRLAHESLLRGSGAATVCTLPLASRGARVGALTFEWSDVDALDDDVRGRITSAGALFGPLLELMARAEAGSVERLRTWLDAFTERHFGEDRSPALWTLGTLGALVLLLGVTPADYRISARATLEGRVQRALVAGVDGYLAEANARAGDLVAANDVLARFDDRDLRLEHRKWQSQRAQLENEYREALAGGARSEVVIMRTQMEQATAQLGLAEERLAHTTVVAPFAGIILEGDLDRSLGSPIEQGTVLFEIAPLDGYRIIVEVDGRDIASVAAGQTGRLALTALPGDKLPLVVERITPMATTKDGRNYFRVEAALERPSETLRPGMEGIAKIDVGRRRRLWIWTHGLLDWLRLQTWSLLP